MDANHPHIDEATLSSAAFSAGAIATAAGASAGSDAAGDGHTAGSNSSVREDTLDRLLELVQAGDDQHDALRAGLEALSAEGRNVMWTAIMPNKIVFEVCAMLNRYGDRNNRAHSFHRMFVADARQRKLHLGSNSVCGISWF